MYDFSHFTPKKESEPEPEIESRQTSESLLPEPPSRRQSRREISTWPQEAAFEEDEDEARRSREVEALLEEQQHSMEMQLEAQERKLLAAGRALKRSRAQAQQLMAQLGLKELEQQRSTTQAIQLRNLLVEKEKRLQEALDEVDEVKSRHSAPWSGCKGGKVDSCKIQLSDSLVEGQPQEPPSICPAPRLANALSRLSEEEDCQIIALSRLAEELAEALGDSRQGGETAQRQLNQTASELQRERSRREEAEAKLQKSLEELERTKEEVGKLQNSLQQQTFEVEEMRKEQEAVIQKQEDRLEAALKQQAAMLKEESAKEVALLQEQLHFAEESMKSSHAPLIKQCEENQRRNLLEEELRKAAARKKGKGHVFHAHLEV
eukprot:TRINITY_DN3992_c0_g2_i1.p1 TRINITY_DN3992_c0_g2~~TRINITY_DN3992_c0_g2_i1.p1  ORF type:complete len:395 (-),score=131.02 TRINITY_DN3992_c0_g2_i1:161-1291(-)